MKTKKEIAEQILKKLVSYKNPFNLELEEVEFLTTIINSITPLGNVEETLEMMDTCFEGTNFLQREYVSNTIKQTLHDNQSKLNKIREVVGIQWCSPFPMSENDIKIKTILKEDNNE